MSTVVRGILAEEIGALWHKLEPLIAKGLEYGDGRHKAKDVCADLIAGRKQLIMTTEPACILITELVNYVDGKQACNVFLAAGDLPPDWRDILAGLEGWARGKGCDSIEMTTVRKGWFRRLPEWKPVRIHMRKEL